MLVTEHRTLHLLSKFSATGLGVSYVSVIEAILELLCWQ